MPPRCCPGCVPRRGVERVDRLAGIHADVDTMEGATSVCRTARAMSAPFAEIIRCPSTLTRGRHRAPRPIGGTQMTSSHARVIEEEADIGALKRRQLWPLGYEGAQSKRVLHVAGSFNAPATVPLASVGVTTTNIRAARVESTTPA